MGKRLPFLAIVAGLLLLMAATSGNAYAGVLPADERYGYFEEIRSLTYYNNELIITDRNVLHFYKGREQTAEIGRGELISPKKSVVSSGILYVLDGSAVKIYRLSDKTLAGEIALSAAGTSIAVNQSKLYVSAGANIHSFLLSRGVEINGDGYSYLPLAELNYKLEASTVSSINEISAIVCAGSDVYYFGTRWGGANDAYYFTEGVNIHRQLVLAYGGIIKVTDAVYSDSTGELIASSPEGVVAISLGEVNQITKDYPLDLRQSVFNGGLKSAGALTEFGGAVYVADNAGGSIQKLSSELVFMETLLCCRGSDSGFYNSPTSLSLAGGKLFIADTGNNRVEVISGGESKNIGYTFHAPTQVAASLTGSVYVLDSSGKQITAFNDAGQLEYSANSFGYITGIAAGIDGSLFLADALNRKIFTADGKGGFTAEDVPFVPSHLFFANNKRVLYLTSEGGEVYKRTDSGFELYSSGFSGNQIGAFTIDHAGQIFALTRDNRVLKWDGFALSDITPQGVFGELSGIAIAFESAAGFNYGDIILTDLGMSKITSISSADSGVNNVDPASYSHPTVSSIEITQAEGRVRVYTSPFSPALKGELSVGAFAVTLSGSLTDNDFFKCILYQSEDSVGYGYVLRGAFESVGAEAPPFTGGRVLNNATPVYSYPLINSPVVKVNGNDLLLERNAALTIHSFAAGYKDSTGARFYKVTTSSGAEGYIHAINVVSRYLAPVTTMPVLNASIVSSNITGAILYDCIDGNYIPVQGYAPIPTGTRVHIVGRFNSSSDYTEIYLIDDSGNVLRFYVETSEVHSNSLSVLQMLALIFALIILASVVLIIILRRRAFSERAV